MSKQVIGKIYAENKYGSISYHPYTSTGNGNYFASAVFFNYYDGDSARCTNSYNGSFTREQMEDYASEWLPKCEKMHGQKVKEESKQQTSNSRKESSKASSNKEEGGLSTCIKITLTIIPILPIWWLIKLPFTMGWAGIKCLWYIITWPFRLLFCCCCNAKLIPEENMGAWPKYDF